MIKTDYYSILFNNINTAEAMQICKDMLNNGSNNLIFFINAHCFNISRKHASYNTAINNAEILLNDGIGFKLGALLAGIRIKENMNGTDFIPRLLTLARDHNKNVYLLGGKEGIARQAKHKLESRLEGISIVGERSGFFDFENDDVVVNDIINRNTEVLIVGMGVPRQELWLTKNKDRLKGVKISVAGGAVLDFISGNVKRAPEWMQRTGTEWIFRLLQEPKRLFHRYFIGIPVFFVNLIKLRIY